MSQLSQSLETFLRELSSRAATPGGGSAAALVGATAAALCAMVGRLNDKKDGTPGALHEIIEPADELRARLCALVDEDIAAFNELAASWKLSEEDADQRERKQAAVLRATQSPLTIMEKAVEVMALSLQGLERSKKNCLSDAGCAALCAHAALDAARLNVLINLPGLHDPELRAGLRRKVDTLAADARRIRAAVDAALDASYG